MLLGSSRHPGSASDTRRATAYGDAIGSKTRYKHIAISFLFGAFLGSQITWRRLPPTNSQSIARGSIRSLSDTPIRNTVHRDDNGQPITKQQFLEPFYIPNLAGYSVATLLPGQRVDAHRHETMHELFYIIQGTGVFTIDGQETPVQPGTFIHVAPHEVHSILVPLESSGTSMQMLVTGVVVE